MYRGAYEYSQALADGDTNEDTDIGLRQEQGIVIIRTPVA
jgi:hypothetical protein